jgi:hypothetical protein
MEEPMDQHDVNRGMAQPPAKDFLALTHGQEWVNFYESFDKLVQDHLSRSSELLRKAMSLPEVADREVAQVRAEMEGKLAAERERSRDLLAKLRDEITDSHDQVSKLAEDVTGVVADLANLSALVSDALATLEKPAESRPAAALPYEVAPYEAAAFEPPALNGTMEEPAGEMPVFAEEPEAVAEPAIEAVADEVPEVESEAESPLAAEFEAVAAAVETQVDAEPAVESDESPLDLSVLAAAESGADESEKTEESEPETGLLQEPVGVGGERPRPHWLSVTRIGSRT